jgi:hypothetical protein
VTSVSTVTQTPDITGLDGTVDCSVGDSQNGASGGCTLTGDNPIFTGPSGTDCSVVISAFTDNTAQGYVGLQAFSSNGNTVMDKIIAPPDLDGYSITLSAQVVNFYVGFTAASGPDVYLEWSMTAICPTS